MKIRIAIILIFVISLMLIMSFSSCTKSSQKDLIIKIPLVTWGGYAALFAANNGASATEDSLFYKYGKFKVELVQEENPANQLQGFANGTYQIIWSTMDMIALNYDALGKDPRTVPKVLGMFDYSAGGDGIIVRGNINDGNGMKGKKIVTAQYTPSHFFIMWYLQQYNLTQNDVQMIFTADAIAAKDTFINDKSIDVCVTWSPFIYDITDEKKDTYVKGAKLLITTEVGNPAYGLIADIYLARSDLVKQNPGIIDAFTKAMLEGYEIFMKDKQRIAQMIASFFGIKGGIDEVMLMFDDVVIGSAKENMQFFNKTDKFSAYSILQLSIELYKKNGNVLPQDFTIDPNLVIYSQAMLNSIKSK